MSDRYGIISVLGPEKSDFLHPRDIDKIDGYSSLALRVGKVISGPDLNGFLLIDINDHLLMIKSGYFQYLDGINYFTGDMVLADGKESKIDEVIWNFKNAYVYYIVSRNEKKILRWYLDSDIQSL